MKGVSPDMIAAIYARKSTEHTRVWGRGCPERAMSLRRSIATTVVAATILLVATQASAECAWVLWVTRYTVYGGKTTGETVLPLDGYALKRDCDKSFDRREKYEAERRQKDPSRTDHFVCLPDTIDLRGPKGGK